MALGRRTEKVEDERGRHATAVPERGYVHEPTTHAARNEVDAEEQVTTATPSASSLARGWIGLFATWSGSSLAVVEVILGFRLGFLLAGANPSNGFVDFIYDISDPLAEPFQGIVSNRGVDGGTFEPPSFIAMLVYLVAGARLIALIFGARGGLRPHCDRGVCSCTRCGGGVCHQGLGGRATAPTSVRRHLAGS